MRYYQTSARQPRTTCFSVKSPACKRSHNHIPLTPVPQTLKPTNHQTLKPTNGNAHIHSHWRASGGDSGARCAGPAPNQPQDAHQARDAARPRRRPCVRHRGDFQRKERKRITFCLFWVAAAEDGGGPEGLGEMECMLMVEILLCFLFMVIEYSARHTRVLWYPCMLSV